MNFLPIQAFLAGAPGAQELIVLFVVILLLFGPKRLPEIARTIGKTLDQLRKGADDFKDQVMKIDAEPLDVDDYSSSDDIYSDAESEDYIDTYADVDDDESNDEEDNLPEESTDESSLDDTKEDRKEGDDVYG